MEQRSERKRVTDEKREKQEVEKQKQKEGWMAADKREMERQEEGNNQMERNEGIPTLVTKILFALVTPRGKITFGPMLTLSIFTAGYSNHIAYLSPVGKSNEG